MTGQFPGKARTADELRSDLDRTLSLLPGSHRVNLHASYAETHGQRVERDALRSRTLSKLDRLGEVPANRHGLQPHFFAHPLAQSGYTLAHVDTGIRRFWIDHGIACRRIGAAFGKALGTPCVTNVWIPDGSKDSPIDRAGPATAARAMRSTQSSPSRSIPLQSRCRRGQALWPGLRELRGRLA